MVTRLEVARYVAEQLPQQRRRTLNEVAAWLVATGRSRQADYLVQDVAMILAQDGYLAARVTTARPLNNALRQEIHTYLASLTGATTTELIEQVDPRVIAGLRLTTPTAELDTTLRHKLTTFVHRIAQGERA